MAPRGHEYLLSLRRYTSSQLATGTRQIPDEYTPGGQMKCTRLGSEEYPWMQTYVQGMDMPDEYLSCARGGNSVCTWKALVLAEGTPRVLGKATHAKGICPTQSVPSCSQKLMENTIGSAAAVSAFVWLF